jgi:hypothetical protein
MKKDTTVDQPKIRANLSLGTLKEIKGVCQERKRPEFGMRNAEVGIWNWEIGMRRWEKGVGHTALVNGIRQKL